MTRLFLSMLVAVYLLTGCASTPKPLPVPTRTIISTKVVQEYPEFPNLKPLPPLNLAAFNWDYPRDMTKWIPQSKKKCLSVPDSKRDNAFWERCGEHPPLQNSNIFMGLNDGQFKRFQLNWAKIRARLQQYKARITEVNNQRTEWRKKAKAANEKMQALQQEQTNNKRKKQGSL